MSTSGREVSGSGLIIYSSDGCGNPQARAYRREGPGGITQSRCRKQIDCLLTWMSERKADKTHVTVKEGRVESAPSLGVLD